ncbi:Adenine deaminase [Desulfonispora thiosulfatigenes DSM 11270]|uniref:Adenine deaminase n=1 Tax=Desulfonispora thiosulfatigenes DSM 11270 TaxID=656914 RepID=A0A1W1UF45_DESTI|nr:adenine deaminase [Desulfonispora thiosulfatigenes]SMB79653.1 Adenine deaminase [Desulfonispora thiosulfatigenes DSM 11270]
MEKKQLKKLIDIAAGRITADLVIKNAKVVDVYNASIIEGDIALCDGLIAGVGKYEGCNEIDAKGCYAAPGFIDSHIHVESSYLSPEELGRLIIPHGTTTIIADPHEITNVCGLKGLNYMMEASKGTSLDVKWMLPSCVPATPFEHAGANINAEAMKEPIKLDEILGLGEFMDFPGVIGANDNILDKLLVAKDQGKLIDGHSPGIEGSALNAYAATRIRTDHECSTVKEMQDRISRGMYILLRQGSACHNLKDLLKGVTPLNSRRCLLCSDDCQPKTILSLGHLDNHLRICVEEGIDPIIAIQMASLNAAECFKLEDRGAIVPGLRADIVLMDNLQDFNVVKVFIAGQEVATQGNYNLPINFHDISETKGSFHVKDFSKEKLRLTINSKKANVINILPGGVVTSKEVLEINRDENGDFVYDSSVDIAKVAVVERHQNTGNVAVALLKGYGIKEGAVALSIAHDSHNIIVVGVNDTDMAFAVEELIKQGGGIILVNNQEILESMPMPIAGLMSNQSGEWVDEKLTQIHEIAHNTLKINQDVEPVMTLCFMSLAVIPEIKLTDMGLFDVTKFEFISNEA